MNQIDLAGKVAIVTGGARGIGYAISQRLLQSGAKVALWDMDADAMAQAEKELNAPGKIMSAKVDITNEKEVDAALAATEKQLGAVDILINNAGIAGPTVKLWEYSPADFRKVVEIELVGPFFVLSRARAGHDDARLRPYRQHRVDRRQRRQRQRIGL